MRKTSRRWASPWPVPASRNARRDSCSSSFFQTGVHPDQDVGPNCARFRQRRAPSFWVWVKPWWRMQLPLTNWSSDRNSYLRVGRTEGVTPPGVKLLSCPEVDNGRVHEYAL